MADGTAKSLAVDRRDSNVLTVMAKQSQKVAKASSWSASLHDAIPRGITSGDVPSFSAQRRIRGVKSATVDLGTRFVLDHSPKPPESPSVEEGEPLKHRDDDA